MLQSALFSGATVYGANPRRGSGASLPGFARNRPGGLSRVAAWGRALLARDDLQSMSAHLLRDIGVD